MPTLLNPESEAARRTRVERSEVVNTKKPKRTKPKSTSEGRKVENDKMKNDVDTKERTAQKFDQDANISEEPIALVEKGKRNKEEEKNKEKESSNRIVEQEVPVLIKKIDAAKVRFIANFNI